MEDKHKISKESFALVLAAAICADLISALISLIPLLGQTLNPIFGLFANMSLWLWAAMNGMGWRGAGLGGVSTIVESLPVISALPAFTAFALAIYIGSRIKEKIPLAGTAIK